MRKIRQVLRQKFDNKLSNRKIAVSLGISREAVREYVKRFNITKLSWPLSDDLGDDKLEQLLFPVPVSEKEHKKPKPDYNYVYQQMKLDGATRTTLHEEFLEKYPDGIGYSQFTTDFALFVKKLKPSMRKIYHAGEFAFVDYAGIKNKTRYINIEGRTVEIFVGVLGASNYIYAEAQWSQQLPDWLAAHVRMFEFFGGVTNFTVCDNLKSAVKKACRKNPILNDAYQNLADHYDSVVLPARPRGPKDKAKAENSVLVVKRWILFRLRKRIFTSLGELNGAIKELLEDVNNRPFKQLPGTRRSVYEAIDLPALKPLPTTKFIYAEFRRVRVNLEYFVNVDGYYFSIPSELVHDEVELRITVNTVEVLHKGRRVASHIRDPNCRVTIDKSHMPKGDRQVMFFNPDDALEWAKQAGEPVYLFTENILQTFKHSIQGYRFNLLMKDLATRYGNGRLNAACTKLMEILEGKFTTRATQSLASILQNGLDLPSMQEQELFEANFDHDNIRGPGYYY